MTRRTLTIDAGIAVVAAVLVVIVAPGLAIVAIVAILVLVVCAISFAVEARARRRGSRVPTRRGR